MQIFFFLCVWMPREAGVQYFVDHGGGEYFVVTNIEGVRIRFPQKRKSNLLTVL